MVRLLFDTNILLDLCNVNRVPFHQDALDLLTRCVRRGDAEMLVCVASLNDVYYVLRRHYGSEEQARRYVGELMECSMCGRCCLGMRDVHWLRTSRISRMV